MKFKILFFSTIFICFCSVVTSQTFQRIETLAGINNLSKNHGVAAADIDGDYDIDLFVVARFKDLTGDETTHSRLFINNNDGTYTDITISAGLGNLHPYEDNHTDDPNYRDNFSYEGYKYGASWGDYDNDGDPDLFLTNAYRLQLFKNNGNNTFTNVTVEAGFEVLNMCFNSSSAWFDYNNDGFLDIYTSDYRSSCSGNKLYKNNGNGTFTDVTNQLIPSNENDFTFMSIPFDFNNDGLLDIYNVNDHGGDNRLFTSNTNGQVYSETSGLFNINNANNAMGIDIADYDNNESFELFVTTIGDNKLFEKVGGGYVNNSAALGISDSGWSWDTKFWDFDNNGYQDIFITNGFKNNSQENKFYVNQNSNGSNDFIEQSSVYGLNHEGYSASSVTFDFDNDGDLDLFVTNIFEPPLFYENKTIFNNQPIDKNWVKIYLSGVTSNKNGVGSIVTVKTDNHTIKRYNTGIGLYSQNILPLHFGLNSSNNINSIEVEWPNGVKEIHENIDVNKHFEITEGAGITELNISPSIKIPGCTDENACNYNSSASVNDGSCTYLAPNQITGPDSSYFLSTDSYTYTSDRNSTFNWSVTGGEILSGQGTKSLTVMWGVEQQGQVRLVETEDCVTEPITVNVDLSYNPNSENFSVARIWNEILLQAIRNDFARPTVHARNLFHTSLAMYDIWAIHNDDANTYLIGNSVHGFTNVFSNFQPQDEINESINKALSYAVYRLLKHRFQNSPGYESTLFRMNLYMNQLGYDIDFTDEDYTTGDSASLGNFVAQSIINYGLQDGSNEVSDYNNLYYSPINEPLITNLSGISTDIDPNRWQPLSFNSFIDQSGNVIGTTTPDFLSPEWGNVLPFSLTDSDNTTYTRDGDDYHVYVDPGSPPLLEILDPLSQSSESYKWGFSLVSYWSAHLDPSDNEIWDISPRSIGDIDLSNLPTNFSDHPNFYKEFLGGDIGNGRVINPITNQPYQEQLVPRGDYTRVLAEFWADGPDSETPPGHWYTILNHVNDHPDLVKKIGGQGNVLSNLEWDIKTYFTLGAAMHDSAISAWSIKGWYDYIRPISAIRYMCALGQSSDPELPSYNEKGIPLVDGYVELIEEGDPLQGSNGGNIGKIKLKAWKGHAIIDNPNIDIAGVDWILGEAWVPYQRPSFVTPPFAGYVSGHSTYSRAAAEILTNLTGSEYFPGGMGEFTAKKNEFLVFEEGPSMDVILQWATYRDASDQCSLSRIWGGIHPPADDIPGRIIGEYIGNKAFDRALEYFNGTALNLNQESLLNTTIHPNPIKSGELLTINTKNKIKELTLFDIRGSEILKRNLDIRREESAITIKIPDNLATGVYILKIDNYSKKIIID